MKLSKKKTGLVMAVAMMVIGAVTVVGAGKVAFTSSGHSVNDNIYSVEELMAQAKERLGVTPMFLEKFSDGTSFEEGYLMDVDAWDNSGNRVDTYPELMVHYKGTKNLSLSVCSSMEWETQRTGYQTEETYEGISIKGSVDQYLFLPPDQEPSEEDKKLEEEGKLMISYGSSEEERKTFNCVSWADEGMTYQLFTFQEIELEDMIKLAKELIDNKNK